MVSRVGIRVRDTCWGTCAAIMDGVAVDRRTEGFTVSLASRHNGPGIDFAWRGLCTGKTIVRWFTKWKARHDPIADTTALESSSFTRWTALSGVGLEQQRLKGPTWGRFPNWLPRNPY